MGYTTLFSGNFKLNKTLTDEHSKILHDLSWSEDWRDNDKMPDSYCKWAPNTKNNAIEWNEGEKFDYYIDWIKFIIKNHITPWGYIIEGLVFWNGESPGDVGVIYVKKNKVFSLEREDLVDWIKDNLSEEYLLKVKLKNA